MSKPVNKMSLQELRQEVIRSRRAISEWVEAYNISGNERCHEVDQELAALVGKSLYQNRQDGPMKASVFEENCHRYIGRECRRGKLIDDRKPNTE